MKPGDTITVLAESLSRHGDGVGTVNGMEIHVAGLLPGETGEVSLDYVSRQRPRAHGSVVTRRNTHPGRRVAPCPHHGRCNGCPLMDMDVQSQRQLKQRQLRTEFGLEIDRLIAAPGEGFRYRWSSKRVVAGGPGRVILGSYMRGTHNIADMSGCLVDHPDIAAAADELAEVASEIGIEPFDELQETGDLRYAWFKTDGRGQVLVALITADPCSSRVRELASALEIPAGVAWGVNSGRGNDMRGVSLRPIRGRQTLEIDFGGQSVRVGPQGFLQPNPEVASMAYRDLVRVPAGGTPHGRLALDLYAGAGVTTRLLARHFARVAPCESFPESARALGIPPMLVEEFLADILSDPHHRLRGADLVVANPPRGGLGPTVCQQLNRLRVPRLHIMSCSPPSLRDDLDRLTSDQGSYRLIQARGFDTLPQTNHVEIVAWLVGRS